MHYTKEGPTPRIVHTTLFTETEKEPIAEPLQTTESKIVDSR